MKSRRIGSKWMGAKSAAAVSVDGRAGERPGPRATAGARRARRAPRRAPGSTAMTASETRPSSGPAGASARVEPPEEVERTRSTAGQKSGLHLHEADAADPQRGAEEAGQQRAFARRRCPARAPPGQAAGRATRAPRAGTARRMVPSAICARMPRPRPRRGARTALANMAATPRAVTATRERDGKGARGNGPGRAHAGAIMRRRPAGRPLPARQARPRGLGRRAAGPLTSGVSAVGEGEPH